MIITVKKFYDLDNNFSGYKVTNPDNIVYTVPLDPANIQITKQYKSGFKRETL
jgi:hypothetical protein